MHGETKSGAPYQEYSVVYSLHELLFVCELDVGYDGGVCAGVREVHAVRDSSGEEGPSIPLPSAYVQGRYLSS
jgi:hypothetical protein